MITAPVRRAALQVLHAARPEYKWMADDPDAIPFVANLCNWLAKSRDEAWYELKPVLVDWLARYHPDSWAQPGIVYTETVLGIQVSFHVFEGEDETAIARGNAAHGRSWTGIEVQPTAAYWIDQYAALHY
jgi:hypothetical protein